MSNTNLNPKHSMSSSHALHARKTSRKISQRNTRYCYDSQRFSNQTLDYKGIPAQAHYYVRLTSAPIGHVPYVFLMCSKGILRQSYVDSWQPLECLNRCLEGYFTTFKEHNCVHKLCCAMCDEPMQLCVYQGRKYLPPPDWRERGRWEKDVVFLHALLPVAAVLASRELALVCAAIRQ